MAYTPDMNSTPPGYMTPDQIKQMYQYSGDLTKGGMRDDTITSPWQGARMMADALSGRVMRNRAGGAQQQGIDSGAAQRAAMPAPLSSPLNTPPPSTTPGTPPQMQAPPQQAPITPTPPIRPPPAMSGMPVQGLQGSVPSGMPGGMPGGPVDPMQALMMQPPGQGMA